MKSFGLERMNRQSTSAGMVSAIIMDQHMETLKMENGAKQPMYATKAMTKMPKGKKL